MNYKKGFTIVEMLLVVLIVAVVGFGGYYVWHSQPKAKVPAPTTSTTTKAPAAVKPPVVTATNILKVPELGIQIINLPASLHDLIYAVNVGGALPDATYADFSTSSLSNMDKDCSPTGHVSDDGILTKHTGTYTSSAQLGLTSPSAFVKQLNGYWIAYGHPQAACSSNATAEALHMSQTKDFQTLVLNPANVQPL